MFHFKLSTSTKDRQNVLADLKMTLFSQNKQSLLCISYYILSDTEHIGETSYVETITELYSFAHIRNTVECKTEIILTPSQIRYV
jgi:hypothetical protein